MVRNNATIETEEQLSWIIQELKLALNQFANLNEVNWGFILNFTKQPSLYLA